MVSKSPRWQSLSMIRALVLSRDYIIFPWACRRYGPFPLSSNQTRPNPCMQPFLCVYVPMLTLNHIVVLKDQNPYFLSQKSWGWHQMSWWTWQCPHSAEFLRASSSTEDHRQSWWEAINARQMKAFAKVLIPIKQSYFYIAKSLLCHSSLFFHFWLWMWVMSEKAKMAVHKPSKEFQTILFLFLHQAIYLWFFPPTYSVVVILMICV